jgi:hypothetical protein
MNIVYTWITVKAEKVDRVQQTRSAASPGPEWRQVPNDWGGNSGDDLSWFDQAGRRIPNGQLVTEGKRQDNRGVWYHKQRTGTTMRIHDLDSPTPGEDWTREEALTDEPYQKWDPAKEKFIVDTERKAQAEKDLRIAVKKSAITEAETRVQRSSLARQRGIASADDEQFFQTINAEIDTLREELRELLAGE